MGHDVESMTNELESQFQSFIELARSTKKVDWAESRKLSLLIAKNLKEYRNLSVAKSKETKMR